MILRVATTLALAVAVSAGPVAADPRSDAKAQVAFGIDVAQRGL